MKHYQATHKDKLLYSMLLGMTSNLDVHLIVQRLHLRFRIHIRNTRHMIYHLNIGYNPPYSCYSSWYQPYPSGIPSSSTNSFIH